MSSKKLEPGVWFAGFDAPFFVTDSMIKSALEKMGFSSVEVFDRESKPVPVNPKIDPNYREEWDQWVRARYDGPTKSVDMPSQVAWLLHSAPPKPSGGTAPPASSKPPAALPSKGDSLAKPATGSKAGAFLVVAGALVLAGVAAKKVGVF